MKKGGFNGPVMVECVAPSESAEQATENARKNREYLRKFSRASEELSLGVVGNARDEKLGGCTVGRLHDRCWREGYFGTPIPPCPK